MGTGQSALTNLIHSIQMPPALQSHALAHLRRLSKEKCSCWICSRFSRSYSFRPNSWLKFFEKGLLQSIKRRKPWALWLSKIIKSEDILKLGSKFQQLIETVIPRTTAAMDEDELHFSEDEPYIYEEFKRGGQVQTDHYSLPLQCMVNVMIAFQFPDTSQSEFEEIRDRNYKIISVLKQALNDQNHPILRIIHQFK